VIVPANVPVGADVTIYVNVLAPTEAIANVPLGAFVEAVTPDIVIAVPTPIPCGTDVVTVIVVVLYVIPDTATDKVAGIVATANVPLGAFVDAVVPEIVNCAPATTIP
jgi:hypothetical protein